VKPDTLESTASSSSSSGEELESAKEFRKNVLKGKGEAGYGEIV